MLRLPLTSPIDVVNEPFGRDDGLCLLGLQGFVQTVQVKVFHYQMLYEKEAFSMVDV